MAKGGKRDGAGRKSKAVEIAYLEAVKEGAPYGEVVKAVRAVIKRAQKLGDPKALTAVLQHLIPIKAETIHRGAFPIEPVDLQKSISHLKPTDDE